MCFQPWFYKTSGKTEICKTFLCETVKLISDFENDKFAVALFWCMGMIILLSPGLAVYQLPVKQGFKIIRECLLQSWSLHRFLLIRFLYQVMQVRRANRLCVDQLGLLDNFSCKLWRLVPHWLFLLLVCWEFRFPGFLECKFSEKFAFSGPF